MDNADSLRFPVDPGMFAIAGDWHSDPQFAAQVIRSLPSEVDVLVHTGDFGYLFLHPFLEEVQRVAEDAGIIVMFVDGNHDDHDWLATHPIGEDGVRRIRPRVWHLPRGFRWVWGGVSFLALGGAASLDRVGLEPKCFWAQECISDEDIRRVLTDGPVDVMITHDAPAGHEIPGLLDPAVFHEAQLERALDHKQVLADVVFRLRPKHLWHGHYHSRYDAVGVSGTHVHGLGRDHSGGGAVADNCVLVSPDSLRGEAPVIEV